jgi:carboxylesterase
MSSPDSRTQQLPDGAPQTELTPQVPAPQCPQARGRSRVRRWTFRFLFALLIVLALYRFVTEMLVTAVDEAVARNDFGIMIGAEERDLGPAKSSGGCLLVHGFVGGSNNFADLPERLAERGWHVRVMRLPGHGTSPRDFENLQADDMVQAVRAELIAMHRRHRIVVLVGHSMGGTLATLAASEIRVNRLVLAAPYFGVTYRWYYGLAPEDWNALLSPVVRWVYKGKLFLQVNRTEAKDKIVSYTWVPSRGLSTLTSLGRWAGSADVLARIVCPVLTIHSSGDVAASQAATQKAVDAMASPEKPTLWLNRSNHHVFWDHEREQVIEAILDFLGTP